MGKKGDDKVDQWAKPSVSGLEADIAYFDARLALLEDEPVTSYQQAQKLTYRLLETALEYNLVRLRNMPGKGSVNSGENKKDKKGGN